MSGKTLVLSGFLALTMVAGAQQQLTNQSILKMHDAGMSNDLIITTINAQPGSYATGIDDLIALKKAGIDDKIVGAMIVKGSVPSAVAPLPPGPPVPVDSDPRPRIFLTSASKGPNQNAARDQSMEMSKDFERDCRGVRISLNQSIADYTVSLNHIEIGAFIRDNQFQIADHNGDLISTTKEGGSIASGVKKACSTILANWGSAHPAPPPPPAPGP